MIHSIGIIYFHRDNTNLFCCDNRKGLVLRQMKVPPLKQPDELYGKTKVALLRRIEECVKAHVGRLPPESELARQLGVSRMLIRDIFGELESRGYISRKHGKGTVINTPVCLATPRIDEEISFVELIRERGMTPATHLKEERWVTGEETGLPRDVGLLEDGKPVLMLTRVVYGDNPPLIYNELFYRGDNLVYDYKKWEGYGALAPNEFLALFGRTQTNVTLAELDLWAADSTVARELGLEAGTGLFRMSDVRYNFDGGEISRGRTVFCPQVLPLKLVRRNR